LAIVPLHRIALIGELKYRDQAIQELQRLGCVHVLDLANTESHSSFSSEHAIDLKPAIAYLDRCSEKRPPPTRSPQARLSDHEEVKQIVEEVLQIENDSRLLAEERETVSDAIEQIRPWGNFKTPAAEELSDQQLFFYRLTHRQASRLTTTLRQKYVAQRINADRQYQYWLFISSQPPAEMPCEPQRLDSRSLNELQARLAEIEQQRERLQVQRIALTRWLNRLRSHLAEVEDEAVRLMASHRSVVDGPIYVLAGWVAQQQICELELFAQNNSLALCARPPQPDEQPPTLLSNPRPIAGAEGAVTFFITPDYRAWDPTWVMYFSFAAFFAMILADAGYGLVLGVILAFAARSLGRTESGRRLRQLTMFMVAVTIGYGLLIGSFFGISPPAGSWLDQLVIKSDGRSIMQDREAMMLIAATIGVFHLMLANVIVAWRWIGSGHALASVGWAVGLIGGWLLALAMIPKPDVMSLGAAWFGGQSHIWSETVTTIGTWLLGVGLGMVFLFSSLRPVLSTRPHDWMMRCVDGVMGLTGVTKAFGDALSYLRLFALGLASAQLAIIFNQLASDAAQKQGIGLLLGLLIFLLGHTLNLVLAVVGGVVHGLRLNCIEFFSWSLTDEGQPFETFEMKANK
jgi:V/A-type H+-transporting ATPase subunit I